MPWKKNADNTISTDTAGNPIWTREDNTEQVVPSISALNAEAQGHRQRADAAEAALLPFKGIDPEKARVAIETTKNIEIGKLIDTGKLEEAKAAVAAQFQGVIATKDAELDKLKTDRRNDKLEMAFKSSDFLKNNVAVPADMFESTFKSYFTVDDNGAIIPKDKTGNVIYSEKTTGPASVDEALAKLVDTHPNKNQILKAANHTGTGNQGGGGNLMPGARVISRTEFNGMQPGAQAAIAKEAGLGKVSIQD